METEVNEIQINGYCHRTNRGYLDSKMKEFEAVGADEQYSLDITEFYNAEKGTKKIFEAIFVKQKPNLIEMELSHMKLFPNSLRLFTEKRWEKLNYIYFSKCSFIQIMLTSIINVLNFSPNVNYLLWKN